MDEEKFKQLHYELWTWISEDPMRTKYHWPKWREVVDTYEYIENHCFACEYFGDCFYCPLNKGTNENPYCTLYYDWENLRENYSYEMYSDPIIRVGDYTTIEKSDFSYVEEKEKIKQAALKIRDAWK